MGVHLDLMCDRPKQHVLDDAKERCAMGVRRHRTVVEGEQPGESWCVLSTRLGEHLWQRRDLTTDEDANAWPQLVFPYQGSVTGLLQDVCHLLTPHSMDKGALETRSRPNPNSKKFPHDRCMPRRSPLLVPSHRQFLEHKVEILCSIDLEEPRLGGLWCWSRQPHRGFHTHIHRM